MDFAGGLRRQRKHKCMTIKHLAEVSGVHSNTITRIEGGLADTTTAVLLKLCSALECDANTLIQTNDLPNTLLDTIKEYLDDVYMEFDEFERVCLDLEKIISEKILSGEINYHTEERKL